MILIQQGLEECRTKVKARVEALAGASFGNPGVESDLGNAPTDSFNPTEICASNASTLPVESTAAIDEMGSEESIEKEKSAGRRQLDKG